MQTNNDNIRIQQRENYYKTLDDTKMIWYVMQHSNPKLIDFQLKRENAVRRQTDDGDNFQLEYFIPFCFLPHTSEKDNEKQAKEVGFANRLRKDLHDFVFIHTTQRGLAKLLDSEWNASMRCRLYHYRDFKKEAVTLGNEEMSQLIRLFSEKRIRLSIGMPVVNLGPDVEVMVIREGTFKGQTARIIEAKPTGNGGISLQLGIKMFGGTKELKLKDFSYDDIQSLDDTGDIIGLRFIREAESVLLGIISRRVNHKDTADTLKEDMEQLNHLFLHSYITIRDRLLHARFLSLMLICATLRFDRKSARVLSERVQSLLLSHQEYSPEILAYLYFSLYIATRDAHYRTVAKQQVQQHPECSDNASLRRLMSLACRMHSKRDRVAKHDVAFITKPVS